MMPARTRSKRASLIQRYFGVVLAVLERDSHDPELRFCSGGGLLPPPLLESIIRVMLSPLDEDLLGKWKHMILTTLRGGPNTTGKSER